jgi:hypothetical protein
MYGIMKTEKEGKAQRKRAGEPNKERKKERKKESVWQKVEE